MRQLHELAAHLPGDAFELGEIDVQCSRTAGNALMLT